MHRSIRWEAPSMPIAKYDPDLLCEQEIPLVIGKNWFLDQEIPAGGFVRILDSSQVCEERVDETRIITMEGLTTCLDPGWGWTITSGGWNFLKRQECWEGHDQALITTIQKETKQMKLDKGHQRGHYCYYDHCSRSILPRELKKNWRVFQSYYCMSLIFSKLLLCVTMFFMTICVHVYFAAHNPRHALVLSCKK